MSSNDEAPRTIHRAVVGTRALEGECPILAREAVPRNPRDSHPELPPLRYQLFFCDL